MITMMNPRNLIFAIIVACTAKIALAEGEVVSEKPAPSSEVVPKQKSESKHHFEHNIPYPSREYEDVVNASMKTGFKGALIGLGSGLAVQFVSYAVTDRTPPASGRVTLGLTGMGFLAGAVWGGLSAHANNKALEKREESFLEKYGMLSPSFTVADNSRVGFGLNYSLSL